MQSLIHADVFFFISAIGFSLLTILASIALVYVILILARWHRISKKIEESVEDIKEEARNFFATLRESRLFSWLFGTRKRKEKK